METPPVSQPNGNRETASAAFPINPILVAPSSIIAIVPFRNLWNNPPGFVGDHVWLALLTPIAAFFVVALGLSWVMTACLRAWQRTQRTRAR